MAHILVVDDEKIIRDGCEKVLTKEGWEVKTAGSGAEGLQILLEWPCDLLLLDLKMPGLSGLEVLQQVKELYPRMLVVVITGYDTVESAVEAMKAGAYDFISKPFLPDQLRIVVRRALEKKALEWEAEQLRREREKGLREIAEEKSKIKTIIQCMADGVLVTDHEGNIVLDNPAFRRLLKVEQAFPKGVADFLHMAGWRELGERIRQVQEGNPVSLEIGHGEVTLMAHIAPVRSEEGEILGTVTVLRDITMLKNIEQMKSDFVALVAHELRAPLASIEQQLAVILAGILGEINQKQQEMLGRAKERTHALLNLIRDLLDLSKIEAGFVVQHKEPVYIEEILTKVVEILKPQAEAKNISIELTLPPSLPQLLVDRRNIEEVFLNLVSNGIKYTNEGGRVWLSGGIQGSYLLIEVGDNGMGIPAEDLPHIFDKFYRVKNVQTRKITGTGLGLPIVKRIVEAHLGTVEVQSQLGEGSIFRVLLPVNLP
ncbi:MAG: response regulator [Thermodesulfobacteriota bacterium]